MLISSNKIHNNEIQNANKFKKLIPEFEIDIIEIIKLIIIDTLMLLNLFLTMFAK